MRDGLLRRVPDQAVDQNFQLVNRNIEYLMGVTVDVTWDPGDTGGDKTVEHGLGVVPTSWSVENQDRPGSVYTGSTPADQQYLYLLCDTPGMQCTIRIRP